MQFKLPLEVTGDKSIADIGDTIVTASGNRVVTCRQFATSINI
jgi:hypothetical protein